jgi:hypothetical protein
MIALEACHIQRQHEGEETPPNVSKVADLSGLPQFHEVVESVMSKSLVLQVPQIKGLHLVTFQ